MPRTNINVALNESGWTSLNDSVMGGKSQGNTQILPRDQGVEFSGMVSLENNGGFASIKRKLEIEESQLEDRVKIEVKGDGKVYQLRFKAEDGNNEVSYSASFKTNINITSSHTFKLDDFVPTWRGRKVSGFGPLTWDKIKQMSFLSGNKQEGKFKLFIISMTLG